MKQDGEPLQRNGPVLCIQNVTTSMISIRLNTMQVSRVAEDVVDMQHDFFQFATLSLLLSISSCAKNFVLYNFSKKQKWQHTRFFI